MTMLSLARDPWRSNRRGERTITSSRRDQYMADRETWTVQMAARRMIRAISGPHSSDDSRFGLQVIQDFTRCSLEDLMVVVRSVVIVASVVRVTSVEGKRKHVVSTPRHYWHEKEFILCQ